MPTYLVKLKATDSFLIKADKLDYGAAAATLYDTTQNHPVPVALFPLDSLLGIVEQERLEKAASTSAK